MEFKHSLLVPYSAEDMFDLIEGAEHYPHFLPFCSGARILERSDEWVAARLEFSYHHLRFGFATHVSADPLADAMALRDWYVNVNMNSVGSEA